MAAKYPPIIMNQDLEKKLIAYYTHYYRDECGLPDFATRVQQRLHEEDKDLERMRRLEKLLGCNLYGKKHFIVGTGTGGLAVVLHHYFQGEVHGIEPSAPEMEIIKLKCQENGLHPDYFKAEYGEKISEPSNAYDFVFCITVLEHVSNVRKCLEEMIRITKPEGKIYINTPNYAYPYEGHYKIHLPTWSKLLSRWWLRALGKPDAFLRTVNLFSDRDLNKILAHQKNIAWLRIYEPLSISGGLWGWWLNYLKFKKGIYPTQDIIITKLP